MATFYFAWVDEGEAFNPAVHNVVDEMILGFVIDHDEGGFPSLKTTVVNPQVGLLGAARNVWCWLSWDNGGGVAELFGGRLTGFPSRLTDERVELSFSAEPDDFDDQKAAAADELKVPPYWDPLWVQDRLDDPDTVLEFYPHAWHIGRTDLTVTASSKITGEDGTIEVLESEHTYDGMRPSYPARPLKTINKTLTVTWTQAGSGTVDLSGKIAAAFQDAGSPYDSPFVASLTADGLLSSWPAPGASLGGGWEVGAAATAEWATWIQTVFKTYIYVKPDYDPATEDGTSAIDSRPGVWTYSLQRGWEFAPDKTSDDQTVANWETWGVAYPLGVLSQYTPAVWTASRKRTETVTYSLVADIQPMRPGPAEDLTLSSDYVDQAIDDDDALPIVDTRHNAFFPTGRGLQALEASLMQDRARLLVQSRCIEIEFTTTFAKLADAGISCRQNVLLHDYRLPGGQATGKIIRYALSFDTDANELKGVVTIGVCIGYGNVVSPAAGTGVIAEDGVFEPGIQVMTGAQIDPGPGDLYYDTLDDLDVLDDDGVDLFNMSPDRVVSSITVTDGVSDQLAALAIFKGYNTDASLPDHSLAEPSYNQVETPPDVLGDHFTQWTLGLVKVGNQSFETTYPVTLSDLMVPQGIDLEAT